MEAVDEEPGADRGDDDPDHGAPADRGADARVRGLDRGDGRDPRRPERG